MSSMLFSRPASRLLGLLAAFAVLLGCFAANVKFGYTRFSWAEVYAAIFHYDESSMNQATVRLTRWPRALIATAVGAGLAVAGAVMQAITRNPLASPSILGVNAAAATAVVFAITVLSVRQPDRLAWIAFAGAAVGAVLVYGLSALGGDGLSPLRLVLAGAAMSALFMSATQGMLVLNHSALQDVLFWLTGTVAGRPLELLAAVYPYILASLIGAWLLSRHLNLLSTGDEAAKGLGLRPATLRIVGGCAIVLLAGSAVAVAGPIGFVGIVIPHIARYVVGRDHRWLIPYCGALGAILLLLADIAARFVLWPQELPVGVLTAALGAPFFIYIARRRRVEP